MGCDQKSHHVGEAGVLNVPKELEDPVLSLTLKSEELDLDLEMTIPVKFKQRHSFHGLLASLAASLPAEVSASTTQSANVKMFDDVLRKALSLRDERHAFYAQVQRNCARMAETLQQMKRDYYREIDHLRAQISMSKRDPNFQPDNVFFFDLAAYQIPEWQAIVDQLDDKRMQRELLVEQGGNSIRQVPLHMLCKNCMARFQLDELPSADVETQTEICDSVDQMMQTDGADFRDTGAKKLEAQWSADNVKPNLPDNKDEHLTEEATPEDYETMWSYDQWRLLDDVKDRIELADGSTQTDVVEESLQIVSGNRLSEHSSDGSQSPHAEELNQSDSLSKKCKRQSKAASPTMVQAGPKGSDDPPLINVSDIRNQRVNANINEDSLQTPAAQSKTLFPQHATASDPSVRLPRASVTRVSKLIGMQCFAAWKNHIVSRRRQSAKKLAAQVLKRQLAALEAHLKRMAFAGWRQAALAEPRKPYASEQSQRRQDEITAIQAAPAHVTSENRLARPTSEPSLGSSSDGGRNFRPSSEETLASRGKRRLQNLRSSSNPNIRVLQAQDLRPSEKNGPVMRSASEVRLNGLQQEMPTLLGHHSNVQSGSKNGIAPTLWSVDDREKWRSERRAVDLEEGNQHALDKMTKPHQRRGTHVQYALRKGVGEQNDTVCLQRKPVQLTLQQLDVDTSKLNSRCSPLSTPQDTSSPEDEQQSHRRLPVRHGLTPIASVPVLGSSPQGSPPQSPQPLAGRPRRSSQAIKGHPLSRLPYASA